MREFSELKVWQEAHKLTLAIYSVTKTFPREEIYGLTSQIRRAAVSVPANIAEGHGRYGATEFHRFCTIAQGSLSEVEYYLILAKDLGFLDDHESVSSQVQVVKALLHGLIRHLTRRPGPSTESREQRAES